MIQTEIIEIRGRRFRRTWSDIGMMIERDGAQYSEAIDPINTERVYEETAIPIESGEIEDIAEEDLAE